MLGVRALSAWLVVQSGSEAITETTLVTDDVGGAGVDWAWEFWLRALPASTSWLRGDVFYGLSGESHVELDEESLSGPEDTSGVVANRNMVDGAAAKGRLQVLIGDRRTAGCRTVIGYGRDQCSSKKPLVTDLNCSVRRS